MNKPASVTEIWEVTRGMLDRFQKESGFGIEWIAEMLSTVTGLKFHPRTVYRYQELNGLRIHLDTAMVLTRITGDPALLKHFTHHCNFAVMSLPKDTPELREEVREIVRAMKETAEAIEVSSRALEDGVIDDREWVDIDREILEGIEELYKLRAVLKLKWEKDRTAK